MILKFEVTVGIKMSDPALGCHDRQAVRVSAMEAVISALATGEHEGFDHELEETTEISVLHVREVEYKSEEREDLR